MAAPVAERRCGFRGLAEGTVERRPVFRGVGDDADLIEPALVERRSDGPDATVHHVGRRDEVGAGHGV